MNLGFRYSALTDTKVLCLYSEAIRFVYKDPS
jgi:hypothetical protein